MQNSQSDKMCCTPESIAQKLKILVLHGYRQNAEVFKMKTGSFRKLVHSRAQFNYVTAPHKVLLVDNLDALEDREVGQAQDEEQYGWFFNRDDMTYRGIRNGGPAIGFEDSVNFIEQVFERDGPFDGVVGFSQGACFLGLLCHLQQVGLTNHIKFNFAIMFSGFKSQSWPHLKYYQDEITLPSMHIYGTSDKIIPTEMSEALSLCFKDPVVVVHDGGHYVPGSSKQKTEYRDFLETQMLKKQQREENKNEATLS
ncbi:esterase AGAP003155 [Sitophilus oryzae]|uniref:Esterase AGAP003155 n=1 Tax=Sitophilus oryzae TaxID=7048 RepID=A0A6J2XZ67_SITOR|nr:esterase AGAP003155 [Sitophilus oryzae]